MNTNNEIIIFEGKKIRFLWFIDTGKVLLSYSVLAITLVGSALWTLSFIIGLVTEFFSPGNGKAAAAIAILVSIATVLMVIGYGVILALLARKVQHYSVTEKRISTKEGAFTIEEKEIHARQIERVFIRQTLLQRIFKAGTITVESNNFTGLTIVLEHVPAPWELYKRINEIRR